MNNQQLQPYERPNALAQMNMRDLKELGDMFYQSGMFPDLKTAAQAMVKIHAGHELGFSPIVSMTGIHFFQGKTVIGANLLASLIKDSGKYEYRVLEHTEKACAIQMMQKFNDKWEKMGVPVSYTIAEAATAGLTGKDVWKKYPKDMLFAAVIRQATRRYCADVLRGTSVEAGNYVENEVDAIDIQTRQEQAPAEEAIDGEVVETVIDVDAEPVLPEEDSDSTSSDEPPFGDTASAIKTLHSLIREKAEAVGEVMLSVGMKKRLARMDAGELGETDLNVLLKDISALQG